VQFVVDIEVTNRCNAKCSFCPRDRTPHQGLMEPEVFEQALHRALELRTRLEELPGSDLAMSLSGLGEPMLNPHVVDYLRRGHDAGFEMHLSTNASRLDEEHARALLDAGLDQVWINVGELGDRYEEVYGLPFAPTLHNVMRFEELAEGRCVVVIVIVDHRADDPAHVTRTREFWARRGFERIAIAPMINRGGSLPVDRMQYDGLPEVERAAAILRHDVGSGLCPAPFRFLFVGYDGQYYLCHSDWEKQVALGSVFDRSLVEIMGDKLRHLVSREPVCRSCNLDPVNRLAELLRDDAADGGRSSTHETLVDAIGEDSRFVHRVAEAFGQLVPAPISVTRIPVRAVGTGRAPVARSWPVDVRG